MTARLCVDPKLSFETATKTPERDLVLRAILVDLEEEEARLTVKPLHFVQAALPAVASLDQVDAAAFVRLLRGFADELEKHLGKE